MKASDAVFEMDQLYNIIIAGCGDGNLLFFDSDLGKCLYG